MSGVARLLRQQGNSAAEAGQEWGWMMESSESPATEVFGATLKQLRTKANLSLRELGRKALYDYTRLSRAERGGALIPENDVATIDAILDRYSRRSRCSTACVPESGHRTRTCCTRS
jgi:hypothetical protein